MLKIWKQPRFAITLLAFCLFVLCSFAVQGQQSELQDSVIFDIIRSGDGQVFAINYGTDVVDLIDATTGTLLHSATLPAYPRRIALDASGDRFVWSDTMANINLYDVATSMNSVLSYGGGVSLVGAMAWNPLNDYVAVARGIRVEVYEITNNALAQPLGEPTSVRGDNTSGVVDLSWSPDGQYLATSHYSQNTLDPSIENYQFQIWQMRPGIVQTTPLIRYEQRAGGSVEWNPDSTLLGLLANNELVIYDFVADEFIEELTFDDRLPFTLVWSPTGDYLATGGTVLRIWDTETWEVVATLPADSYVSATQWSPDGQVIYSNRGVDGLSIDRNPTQIAED